VQTPVLAMIVERDDTILQFRPQPFWELTTRYREVVFKYSGKRFENKEKAQALLKKITEQPFEITDIAGKKKKEQPPQLFDLTTLQREINKLYGLSASDTLAAAQNLYEGKLITYPRTDSRYLGRDMKQRIPKIFGQLKSQRPDQIEQLNLAKLPFTKRIIDDKKVPDHHAIIPTGVKPRRMATNEELVYNVVTTQFIAAFYPVCVKNITTVDGVSNNVKFTAKGIRIIEPGWTVLFPKKKNKTGDQTLPDFEKGETGPHEPFLREGKTKPPSHFTENSLLGAMEAAGKFVDDDTLREALKERGIGTPATRAAIIETLLRRNYVRREKKQLRCTDMGRCLITLIQDSFFPMLILSTGEWEEKLKQIERGLLDPNDFMAGIGNYIRSLIQNSSTGSIIPSRWGSCPFCGKEIVKGKKAYGCSDWKNGCSYVFEPDYKGISLRPRQIQVLLQLHYLPYPIRIDNESRMLILSTQGMPMDLQLPSGDRQKK